MGQDLIIWYAWFFFSLSVPFLLKILESSDMASSIQLNSPEIFLRGRSVGRYLNGRYLLWVTG